MAKILVIDDEESIRHTVRRALEREGGHEIFEAVNGKAAFEYLETHAMDLIVTDLYMPDMDGIELTIRISQLKARPRIIAMTGGGFTEKGELLEIAKRLGADRTLAKPFAIAELVDAVRSLVPGGTS